MVTIRDLAKITGYSTSMISRVLNQHPYVDEEKRKIILAAIEETNYRPNAIARNLSLGKSYNIGVILPYIHMSYFEQIVSGILQTAFQHNYKVTLLPTNYDKATELEYLEELTTKHYDGLIITSKANDLKTILNYQKYGPIIFCEELVEENVASVSINREKAFLDIVQYFKENDITKVGVITGRNEHSSNSAKQLLALAEAHLPEFDNTFVFRDCTTFEDGFQAAKYFHEVKNVEGIISNGDEIAAAIYEYYQDKKIISIISQDNSFISQLLNFPAVDYHLIECGRTAFSLFIENRQEKIRIIPSFIERKHKKFT
ncbi:DNA-binding LacI/PurR family transcriptional regulator [Enterococcus sp. PF1-24]|uniref:LacI family DNA-binding transcriptional regulator n=1 Tax=unclassified Enterococcus TaxID=2608891 RepID=UPI002475A796|nr:MULTISPECIES: LacI family DNA-binding transcriptional regulator [unclassified Enterococcus]MDH6364982.1 DNA-binding LacI/PurR family transcriptional regulator [Enterococcus sp. PFB1-1]MDH6402083.1 DNA-binding LacI/PurR family transcriptional regulator [Enterococcus sp. PF1-24]